MTRTRILAALLMAPVAIAAVLLLNTPWMAAVSAIVFLIALWEWLRLAGIEDTLARTALLALNLLLMVAIVWASATGGGSLVLLKMLAMLGVAWWLAAALWLRHYTFASAQNARSRIIKLLAGTLAVIPAWAALCVIHANEEGLHGERWLLVALAIIWATDTGAYFAGRKFGRRKLSPRISPNKTVEGMAGGAIAGVAVAVAFAPLAGASLAQLPLVAVVALLAVVASVVGDLFESLLKRHAGAKDSGTLIPGHGGVLDRIDSVLTALPVFAFGQIWFGF